MNRTELQQLASTRLRDARILFDGGCTSGAYYLAGYSVECALKAVISRGTQQYDFPEKDRVLQSFTHDLTKLRKVALLDDRFLVDARLVAGLGASWTVVAAWSEQARYAHYDSIEARALIEAIDNAPGGVLTWIMRYW